MLKIKSFNQEQIKDLFLLGKMVNVLNHVKFMKDQLEVYNGQMDVFFHQEVKTINFIYLKICR